jgi:hypothetical protein
MQRRRQLNADDPFECKLRGKAHDAPRGRRFVLVAAAHDDAAEVDQAYRQRVSTPNARSNSSGAPRERSASRRMRTVSISLRRARLRAANDGPTSKASHEPG